MDFGFSYPFLCVFLYCPHRTIPRYVELRLIFRSVFEDFTHLNTHTHRKDETEMAFPKTNDMEMNCARHV